MTNPNIRFFPRTSIEQVEEGTELAPRFDADGLIACITTDASSGEVLMLGYMNDEALQRTIATGEAHYWSRSRQLLWHKGATSGLVQHVEEMRVDDDQDAIWIRVSVAGNGASCHVGYRSCFYRQVPVGSKPLVEAETDWSGQALVFNEDHKVFDPEQVYEGMPNPTLL
ncbi:phosphoribosyl-AMP cyclohydrolase [Oceanobacter mangrovi]|uniref:phosphoribosyl-AMP cyclohydrolase n=1 Tax=Oceanobacter mangrovi TaxID=2862510 RepID=UPI001C8E1AFD|nr:phosphoribosyl-AMP cyclohydrolase [Oceanobacter mangrovi]